MAYGLDITEEMLTTSIYNCVNQFSTNKAKILREVARVLRPGGRFARQ